MLPSSGGASVLPSSMRRTQRVVQACYTGGIRAFEFVNRGEQAMAEYSCRRLWPSIARMKWRTKKRTKTPDNFLSR
jgi:hypothetical protein